MLRRAPSGQGGGNDAAGPWEGRVLATVERTQMSLRLWLARTAVLVTAAALLALTGARSASAPPAPWDKEQLAQASVDQPFQLPDTTDDEEDDADTLDVVPSTAPQQASPDTSHAPQSPALDETPGFRPDTLNAVPPGATADSVHTGAQPDTLFMPSGVLLTNPEASPTPTTQAQPQGAHPPGPIPEKKPRSGILGIHPIAILVGLAALHIAVTHLAE